MPDSRRSVYHEPESPLRIAEHPPRSQTITLPLAEVLPLLAEALRSHRLWVNDFVDDEVTISRDLYEVLLAYDRCYGPLG